MPGPDGTVMKLVRAGSGPVVGREDPAFSGYAWTFYTDDGFGTGTSLELKTWSRATEYERAILAGRRADDVVRVWDCTARTKLDECTVSDYWVLSLPRGGS